MERIQLRRDSAAAWASNNPILASGEMGIELPVVNTDPVKIKVGNGIHNWNTLPYQPTGSSGGTWATLAENTFTGQQAAPSFSSPLFKGNVTNLTTGPGTQALSLSSYDYFNLLLNGNTTLSLSSVPSLTNSEYTGFIVRISQGSTPYTITWWSGITWLTANGLAPNAPAAGKSREYLFTTADGTNFIGRAGSGT